MAGTGWFTYDDFAHRVGDRFDVGLPDGGMVELTLVEAELSDQPGGPGPDGAQRQQFSLVFRGPADPFLPQATWDLSHGALGDLALFLVPLGRDDDGVRYEAAFA